jgi:hypothetical protein
MIHQPTTLRICWGLSCGCKLAISSHYTLVSTTYTTMIRRMCEKGLTEFLGSFLEQFS